MVQAMHGGPGDRTAFERKRPADSKKVFEKDRDLVRAVRVQPVVPHADAEADSQPVEKQGDGEKLPSEHEQGRYSSDV